jgi:hypothetical protein
MNDDSLHVKVFVQRETIELDVLPTTSVAELSQQILARFKPAHSSAGTEYNRVRVIHRGRVLPAEKTLQQCNLFVDDEPTANSATGSTTLADSSATSTSVSTTSSSSTSINIDNSVGINDSAEMSNSATSAETPLTSAPASSVAKPNCIVLHAALSYVPPSATPATASSSARPSATLSQSLFSRLRPSFASVLASADARPVQTSVISNVSSVSAVASTSAGSAGGALTGSEIDLERGDFYDQSRRRQHNRDASDDELDPVVVRRRTASHPMQAHNRSNSNNNDDDDTSSDEGRAVIADDGAVGVAAPAPSGVAAAPSGVAGGYDSDEERETGGFDAFRRFGFSAADVAALRRDFHRTRPASRAAMFRAEEQWLSDEARRDDADVQRGLAEDAERALRNGHEHDFVLGLVLGFSFSVLSVLFLSQRFLTRRGQVGIYLGIVTNLMMGLSKVFVGFP